MVGGYGGQAFFGVSADLSDMEINLEFFAKVKAIKLYCCLGTLDLSQIGTTSPALESVEIYSRPEKKRIFF